MSWRCGSGLDGQAEATNECSPGPTYIRGSSPRIFVDDRASAAPVPYDREVFQERQYYIPLTEVLVQSRELSQDRLVSFVGTAVDHLNGRRSHIQQDRNDAEPV